MQRTMAHEALPNHSDYRHLSSIQGIQIDLRYGSPNNFLGRDLYSPFDCAWLHLEAAQALQQAVRGLHAEAPGTQILVLDALRPQRITELLWQALVGTPNEIYVANPVRGSVHSFGMALDVTLVDENGTELDMGTAFDEFDERSHPAHEAAFLANGKLTAEQVANRHLLRRAMTGAGFRGISTEWWHFDCGDRERVRAEFCRIL